MERKVVIPEFWGPGEDLYQDQLGWQRRDFEEARTQVSKDVFNHMIVTVGFNLTFYYVDNDTYYGIHAEELPIPVKILPRANEPYIDWQCKEDSHADGVVIGRFNRDESLWEELRIDGKTLEEVLQRSVIMERN